MGTVHPTQPDFPRLSLRSAGVVRREDASSARSLMNLRLGRGRPGLEEIEVAAFIGLPDMVGE